MSLRSRSFAPVVRPDTRILILGSLPGQRSLAEGQYYAHPRNRFWHLVGRVTEIDFPALDYPARLDALLAHGIGLWDAVQSARRKGSLDADMRDVEATDLPELVNRLPRLRAVAFNGKASERIGRPQLSGMDVHCLALPSSSPAHAAMNFDQKAAVWDTLRQFLR